MCHMDILMALTYVDELYILIRIHATAAVYEQVAHWNTAL